MPEEQLPQKFIGLIPDSLDLAIGPDREVIVKLRGFEKEVGLTPGIGAMMALSPTEARRFARALIRTANKAEVGRPPAEVNSGELQNSFNRPDMNAP